MEKLSLNLPKIELINFEKNEISPLISKCQIKVCYVSDEPNRNGSIITKEVAKEMASSLRGSAIVGFYNEEKQDFEGHKQELIVEEECAYFKDMTRPYGFVDVNAPVWFEVFRDGDVDHEYLMTEGYLWTGQYPEAERIIDYGNNQSMELDPQLTSGYWAIDDKENPTFFIINEAIISKLCILGEDVEPCFEGASITKLQFSLDDEFETQLFALMEQTKKILQEGELSMNETEVLEFSEVEAEPVVEEEVADEIVVEEAAVEEVVAYEMAEEAVEETAVEEVVEEVEVVAEPEAVVEEAPIVEEPNVEEMKYNLEDIHEYAELSHQYSELKSEYETLSAAYESMKSENEALLTFKLAVERKEKEKMIQGFYMLSDEDKKDVIENIDKYSLDEIEAKLSVICVRNRVNFSLEENVAKEAPTIYSLSSLDIDDSVPALVRSLRTVANEMK